MQLTDVEVRTFEGELPNGFPSSSLPKEVFHTSDQWELAIYKHKLVDLWKMPVYFKYENTSFLLEIA